MNKYKRLICKNQHGVSLIEVLAVLVIGAIVMALAMSFVISSNKQNHAQQDEVRQIYDSAYILKLITKDIRSATSLKQEQTDQITTYFLQDDDVTLHTYEYSTDGQLKRDGQLLNRNMTNFNLTVNEKVHIEFTLNDEKSSTHIAFRNGGTLY